MLAGFNHVALLTEDIDRFIAFYRDVFDASVMFDLREGEMRHAWLDIGDSVGLHVFAFPPGHPDACGSDALFGRGHIDHAALNCADEDTFEKLRRRLVEHGASDGAVTDWGPVKTCAFRDPDGMDSEIALNKVGRPRTFDERVVEPL